MRRMCKRVRWGEGEGGKILVSASSCSSTIPTQLRRREHLRVVAFLIVLHLGRLLR